MLCLMIFENGSEKFCATKDWNLIKLRNCRQHRLICIFLAQASLPTRRNLRVYTAFLGIIFAENVRKQVRKLLPSKIIRPKQTI